MIAEEMEKVSPVAGEIEVDESSFGGARKAKRGRERGWESPRFGAVGAWWESLTRR